MQGAETVSIPVEAYMSQNPHLDDLVLDDLTVEDLVAEAMESLEDDLAFLAHQENFGVIMENGEIDEAKLAAASAALACAHTHGSENGDPLSSPLEGMHEETDNGHRYNKDEKRSHDENTCSDCRAGRKCSRRK